MAEIHDRFRQAWDEAGVAKGKVMRALGRAKLAEKEGRDANPDWDEVVAQGFKSGEEGRLKALARSVADEWFDANPAKVAEFEETARAYQRLNPDLHLTDQQALAPYADILRAAGRLDELAEVEMYLMSKFEPQHVGGRAKAQVRIR